MTQTYGPIFRTYSFIGPEVVVTSPELVRQVLGSNLNRAVQPAMGTGTPLPCIVIVCHHTRAWPSQAHQRRSCA